jgi:hypothetical protein
MSRAFRGSRLALFSVPSAIGRLVVSANSRVWSTGRHGSLHVGSPLVLGEIHAAGDRRCTVFLDSAARNPTGPSNATVQEALKQGKLIVITPMSTGAMSPE